MPRIVDNLIAFKVLTMLVTSFVDTDAYKLGIIDADGKTLVKASKLTTSEEKDAFTYLHRLVFNVKKLINRLPGGDSKLKNIVAALWLVKESYENKRTVMFEDYTKLLKVLDTVTLVEEEIEVRKFFDKLAEDGAVGAAVVNTTGAAVSTDIAVPKKKDINKYKAKNSGVLSMTRRPIPVR